MINPVELELKQEVKETLPYLLSVVFCETYVILTKFQSCHWNYTNPDFYQKHLLFERLYTETYQTLDRIAENIRSLDSVTPVCLYSILALSKVQSTQDDDPTFTQDRLYILIEDVRIIKKSIADLATTANFNNKQAILNLCGDLDELYSSFYYLISSHLK